MIRAEVTAEFEAGRRAFSHEEKSYTDNPHPEGSDAHLDWKEGYRQAYRAHYDRNPW